MISDSLLTLAVIQFISLASVGVLQSCHSCPSIAPWSKQFFWDAAKSILRLLLILLIKIAD